jgi:hypothetical protein
MNVIIAEPITELGFFWLGGGHIDNKISNSKFN